MTSLSVRALLLVSFTLTGCGESKNRSEPFSLAAGGSDATELISNSQIGFASNISNIVLGSGVFGDATVGRQSCYTGNVVKMNGLSKVIYQIESKYDEEQNVWSYYIAAYRIQSISQLVNAKPNEPLLKFFGREEFEQECGRRHINKVFSGQRLFFQANIAEIKGYLPSSYSFLGTSQLSDVRTFIEQFDSTHINFNKGSATFQSGTSKGMRDPYNSSALKNTVRSIVYGVNELAKQNDLSEETLEIYGVGSTPKY